MSARPRRGKGGRFIRRFDRQTLYEIAKQVSTAAARRLKKDPWELTHKEWNSGRKHLRHTWEKIPQAHEICRQLSNYDGRPIKLGELLRAVFEQRNLVQYDAARLRHPERPITAKAANYALRRVAFALQAKTLTPLDYEEGRELLLHLASQRSPHEEIALRDLLPTVNQILHHHNHDWDTALAKAQLKPRPKSTGFKPRPGVSVPLAIALQHAETGAPPLTPHRLRKFASTRFGLQHFSFRDWDELYARGLREIEALHLPAPLPPGQRLPDHQPIPLNIGPLPPPRTVLRSRVELTEWGIRYREWLEQKPSGSRAWARFVREHPSAPALVSFNAHGGLEAVLREGTKRGWRARAEAHDKATREHRSRAAKARASARPARSRQGLDRQRQISDYLREHGATSTRQLAEAFQLSIERITQILRQLEQNGLAERTQANPRSARQTYQLTSPKRRRKK